MTVSGYYWVVGPSSGRGSREGISNSASSRPSHASDISAEARSENLFVISWFFFRSCFRSSGRSSTILSLPDSKSIASITEAPSVLDSTIAMVLSAVAPAVVEARWKVMVISPLSLILQAAWCRSIRHKHSSNHSSTISTVV
jgi:hypothetical protein